MNQDRIRMINERIRDHFPVAHLEVIDESHLHAGHAGAADGRGHFKVIVVSDAFSTRSPLQRHRLIYEALGDAMVTDIHALSIHALSPAEDAVDQQS
jgi:BolA family transcriptional regulator, general stress-responsive regulator